MGAAIYQAGGEQVAKFIGQAAKSLGIELG
jgi:hypothetical protein